MGKERGATTLEELLPRSLPQFLICLCKSGFLTFEVKKGIYVNRVREIRREVNFAGKEGHIWYLSRRIPTRVGIGDMGQLIPTKGAKIIRFTHIF